MIHLIRQIIYKKKFVKVSTSCGGNASCREIFHIVSEEYLCKYLSFLESFLLFNCARVEGVRWIEGTKRTEKYEKTP